MRHAPYSYALAATAMAAALILRPLAGLADPMAELEHYAQAFGTLKSWHAEMKFSNGHSLSMDYAGPDHVRILIPPQGGEAIIGKHMYVNDKGKWTELPSMVARFTSGKLRQQVPHAPTDDIVAGSVKDLGMQPLNGGSFHAFSFATKEGATEELWLMPNGWPVQSVINSKNMITTIDYSKYNEVTVDSPEP